MNPFQSLREYEQFVYTLQQQFTSIHSSTLVVAQRGRYYAELAGELFFSDDSQPHPDDPTLASTHPHHKHIPPDIKHHRIPAPGLTFAAPNLPLLILEIESLLTERPRYPESV